MSTGYSRERIRQVRATLLGARHVPELKMWKWPCLLGALYQVLDLYLSQHILLHADMPGVLVAQR